MKYIGLILLAVLAVIVLLLLIAVVRVAIQNFSKTIVVQFVFEVIG